VGWKKCIESVMYRVCACAHVRAFVPVWAVRTCWACACLCVLCMRACVFCAAYRHFQKNKNKKKTATTRAATSKVPKTKNRSHIQIRPIEIKPCREGGTLANFCFSKLGGPKVLAYPNVLFISGATKTSENRSKTKKRNSPWWTTHTQGSGVRHWREWNRL